MAFQYLTVTPLAEAIDNYFATLIDSGMQAKSETVPVPKALNRRCARAVYANICAPHYHACAMDGIAIDAALSFGATETTPVILKEGQYIPVDTGDPLPSGCDAVVMIENVLPIEEGVKLLTAAVPWQHVRQIGEDICAGDMILPSLNKITPSAMGAMLAGGVMNIEVIKKPLVGFIPTGDEIIPPKANPQPGDIIEFNSTIFAAMLEEWGASSRTYPIVKDDPALIEAALQKALDECEVVLLGAGSSAGRDDYSTQAIAAVGTVLYHGIAIKPGKPAILGYQNEKIILGVPGYPTSGIIVLENILKPLIDYLLGQTAKEGPAEQAILARRLTSPLKYEEFIRVRLGYVNNKLIATPLDRGGGVISSFMKADGILRIPQSVEGYEAGASVSISLLRPIEDIKQSLVITGSHDPLIDELADMMRRHSPFVSIGSSHVGSMGGIMAIKRQEAHAAGIHLFDEESGEYNTAFIKKFFPNGGLRLVECVKRSQGLMVAKGNPKNISGIQDITKAGFRYINRQKGSGTRILCDYLLQKESIDEDSIYGYHREEFTHTAVSALIAADSADAGMGIYSAAQIYNLDFIPICDEEYDLLIPDYAWDTPTIKELLEIIQSEQFRHRLEEMGGYLLDTPGRVKRHF